MSVALEWVATAAEVPEGLWARAFPPPLEGEWWYRALECSGLEEQFRFAYGVLRRGGEPIGIVPVFEMDVPIDVVAPPLVAKLVRAAGGLLARLRWVRTVFVGSPCSDEGTVGLVPGERLAPLLDGIEDALDERAARAGASMVVWKDFPDDAGAEIEPWAKRRGLFRVVSFPGARVSLRGASFEDYVAGLEIRKRHRLRRNLRRGDEALPVTASVVERPDADVLAEVFALFWQTYEHGKTKFERLTPRFFDAIAAAPPARFVLLRDAATGRLAAFMLLFHSGERAINKFIGLDYALGREAKLYFRLWEHAVRWAYAAGATELQSGQTGYGVKLDLGHELVPLTNWCRHRNRVLHAAFAAVTSGVDWASLDEELKHAPTCGS